jgi:hypothetical protein
MLAMGRPEEALQKIQDAQLSPRSQDDQNLATVLTDLSYKCKAALLLRSGMRGSTDPDAIATSILSSGAIVTTKAAKVLARLNLRRIRESEDCTHAWRDWQPPTDSETEGLGCQMIAEGVDLSPVSEQVQENETHTSHVMSGGGKSSASSDKIKSSGVKVKADKNSSTADNEKAIAKSKKEQFMRMMKSL